MLRVCAAFQVRANARYLSHAETMRVFQRALVRAGIDVEYSGRFNPRCRLSLPLPRPVAVETDADMLNVCLRGEGPFEPKAFLARLSAALPAGFMLLNAELVGPRTKLQPRGVTYRIAVKSSSFDDDLKMRIGMLSGGGSVLLNRRKTDGKQGGYRKIDSADFLTSVAVEGGSEGAGEVRILVECKVEPQGTLRVDEILELLGLRVCGLAAPVRRTRIQWEGN